MCFSLFFRFQICKLASLSPHEKISTSLTPVINTAAHDLGLPYAHWQVDAGETRKMTAKGRTRSARGSAGEATANANSNRGARTRLEAATVKLIRKQSFRATSVDQIARAASTYANDLLPALQEQERSHPLSTAIVHSRDPDFCDQSNAHIDQRTARRPAQFSSA